MMEDFTVGDVLRASKGRLVKGDSNSVVSGISTDSRTLAEGDLFVALKGEKFDGHDFIIQAVSKKAAGMLVSREVEETNVETIIQVEDTLQALGDIAGVYRNRFSIPVVGITGSNGKTTTKDMTASVLARKYSVLKNEGNLNNAIGVPLTLFRLSGEHKVAVIEMGTGVPGEMARLVEIAQPSVAVVTNIGATHQEFFGSVDEVAVEKSVLVKAAGSAVLNADDPRVAGMIDVARGTVISFGLASDKANVLASEIRQDRDGRSEFTLVMEGKPVGSDKVRIRLEALGRHNIYNALAAASVGRLFHVGLHEIKEALESYQGTSMRMQKSVVDGITIINDAYNSNPASLRVAVELLSEMECNGRRVAVVGDMLELGVQADELHRAAGRFIAGYPVDLLVTVGDKAARIAEAALTAGVSGNRAAHGRTFTCKTNLQAVEYLREALKAGDTVLIKGSRGMKMEEIAEALKREFGG